ncbi:MAG: Asd/ArgC dimerization domain-containing protein [Candidatus Binatia bacterium]|nr:Asd/ArgC dimerization domain-containing protein [Candidatus Binatia bacterium]
MTGPRVTIVGDDAEISEQILRVLLERGFGLEGIRALGGEGGAGDFIEVDQENRLRVERADALGLAGADAVLFSGDGDLASELVDHVPHGVLVLDATPAASARTGSVPIVPEVNADLVGAIGASGPLALASPATVGLAVALAPLHEAGRVRRVVTTVMYPASTNGRDGAQRLSRQSVALMQGAGLDEELDPEHFAFNLRPQRGDYDSPWSADEHVLAREISAIFGEPAIEVVATGVRAPVFYGIGQSVYVETEEPLDPDEAERLLLRGRGLLVAGSTQAGEQDEGRPEDETPIEALDLSPGPIEVAGSDAVHVAHVRADPHRDGALAFWLCLDDQRKGVALNAVATLEIALRDARG